MKKIIKLACVGFDNYGGYEWLYHRLLKPLEDEFSFKLDNSNPDFCFCTILDHNFDFIKYNCPRIFVSEENTQPMFQFFDYWIGYDYGLNYRDRFLKALFCVYNIKTICPDLSIKIPQINKKEYFCDFIYSHDDNGRRTHYFNLLNSYKKVSSFGVFNHTSGDPYCGKWPYKEKIELQRKCKFSLIIESCTNSGGLITEKIFHSLIAGTIPIYLGEDNICDIVNPKRIINIKDFKNDDELINKIIEIDNNDELYEEILSEEPLIDPEYFIKQLNNTNKFLKNIFNQDPIKAIRRPYDECLTIEINNLLRKLNKKKHNKMRRFLAKMPH